MPEENARLMALYRRQATSYDQSGIQGLDAFRREAVRRLELKRGDLERKIDYCRRWEDLD